MKRKVDKMRQGDILLRKIEKVPVGAVEKDKVLALGEVTGHWHGFAEDSATKVYQPSNGGNQVVVVEETSELMHQEHKFEDGYATIEPGIYEVIHQRELSMRAGAQHHNQERTDAETRRVLD